MSGFVYSGPMRLFLALIAVALLALVLGAVE